MPPTIATNNLHVRLCVWCISVSEHPYVSRVHLGRVHECEQNHATLAALTHESLGVEGPETAASGRCKRSTTAYSTGDAYDSKQLSCIKSHAKTTQEPVTAK